MNCQIMQAYPLHFLIRLQRVPDFLKDFLYNSYEYVDFQEVFSRMKY